MRYEFIKNQSEYSSIEEMCECLNLSRSGYYSWLKREQSERKREDEAFKKRIEALHQKSRGRYGYRPIYHHLKDEDLGCGRDRTLRLMNELGLSGAQKKPFKPLGTDSRHSFGYSANLLKELGCPQRCDHVWVADTTYLLTDEGWCYLATIMDLFSRRIIGWSVSNHNDTQLCSEALKCAVLTRAGDLPADLIHHSDRGSTYASYAYENMLNGFGIRQSMSAKGNCYDNAAMESFFGRFKISSVGDIVFTDEEHARSSIFEYIEVFYNRFRKHASLGYQNPIEFEEQFALHERQKKC